MMSDVALLHKSITNFNRISTFFRIVISLKEKPHKGAACSAPKTVLYQPLSHIKSFGRPINPHSYVAYLTVLMP
jgi:hypothetical protein